MTTRSRRRDTAGIAIAVAAAGVLTRAQRPAAPPVHVRSTPENVVANWFPIDRKPVVRVAVGVAGSHRHAVAARRDAGSGSRSSSSGRTASNPTRCCRTCATSGRARNSRPPEERGGHILTGPIYVDGAEPGDTLAIEVVELSTRVPYGINTTGANDRGVRVHLLRKPGDRVPEIPANVVHLIRTGRSPTAAMSRSFPKIFRCRSARSWASWRWRPTRRRSASPASGWPAFRRRVRPARTAATGLQGARRWCHTLPAGVPSRGALLRGRSARRAGRRRNQRQRARAVIDGRLSLHRAEGQNNRRSARGDGDALFPDGDRRRSRSRDCDRRRSRRSISW